MRAPRQRCGECGKTYREEDTAEVRGQGGGSYRRANRWIDRRVCRKCTQARVDYARESQAEGHGAPLNGLFNWSDAADRLGIDRTGIYRTVEEGERWDRLAREAEARAFPAD